MNKKIYGIIIGLIGFTIIIYAGGWLLTLGIFIFVWGNNLEKINN